jgi:hypothetical protein
VELGLFHPISLFLQCRAMPNGFTTFHDLLNKILDNADPFKAPSDILGHKTDSNHHFETRLLKPRHLAQSKSNAIYPITKNWESDNGRCPCGYHFNVHCECIYSF